MLELNLLCDLGSLAYATAQVVQLSTANLTAANNLELSNVRGMYREGLLYAYAVRNAANGYSLVYASVLLSNDDAFGPVSLKQFPRIPEYARGCPP